jgi:hypothetical protein
MAKVTYVTIETRIPRKNGSLTVTQTVEDWKLPLVLKRLHENEPMWEHVIRKGWGNK